MWVKKTGVNVWILEGPLGVKAQLSSDGGSGWEATLSDGTTFRFGQGIVVCIETAKQTVSREVRRILVEWLTSSEDR